MIYQRRALPSPICSGPVVVRSNFQEVLDIIPIKIRLLKGNNKWEIPVVNYTHDNEFTCSGKSTINSSLLIQFKHLKSDLCKKGTKTLASTLS